MADSDVTRPSLLLRLRDVRDQLAWGEFVEIYSPLVYGLARKHGLQDADAVDVTQDVLRRIAHSIGRLNYDAGRGTFRGWLFTIVRNEIRDWFAKQRSVWIGNGDAPDAPKWDQLPDSVDELSQFWEREHQQRVFFLATEQIRKEVQESTWQAFWKTTVNNQPGKDVAAELGLSIAAVYLAKGRVMLRLKELVQEAEA
jgi:RNA polymerase sigma factor (sigma-70 family)